MKRFKSNLFAQVLSFVAIAFFVLPVNAGAVLAKEEIKATTKIKHKPIKYFVSEKRIKIEAKVTDKEGVNLVRCYFRAAEQADYVFVAMNAAGSLYEGILPAPSKDTEMLEYLFLVVNGKNQVVKTQTFTINQKDKEKVPAWQQVSAEGDIHVSTELAQAPETLQGFTDSIVMDVVESSARFGTVAGGIYLASKAGGVSGAAAASTTAGTVTAGAGLSTAAIIGIGVAAAAGVGAAAAGVGGDDDGGGGGGGLPVTVTGVWELHFKCVAQSSDAVVLNVTLNETAGGAFSGSGSGTDYDGTLVYITLNGTYNSSTHFLSMEVTTTAEGSSCVRKDTFSTTLTSNDTGYIQMTQTQVCGCTAEMRMIKL